MFRKIFVFFFGNIIGFWGTTLRSLMSTGKYIKIGKCNIEYMSQTRYGGNLCFWFIMWSYWRIPGVWKEGPDHIYVNNRKIIYAQNMVGTFFSRDTWYLLE